MSKQQDHAGLTALPAAAPPALAALARLATLAAPAPLALLAVPALIVALVAVALSGCGAAGAAGGASAAAAERVMAPPPPSSPQVIVEWRRVREPRERATLGLDGVWLGAPDEPRAHFLFARQRYADDLALFARQLAPFRAADPEEGVELVFHGHGTTLASVAERRMLFAWCRRAMVETGASPSPFGLALAWHRGAANGGICDDLAVFLSGEARAGACGNAPEARGRLSGEQLTRLYAWVDTLQPFQSAEEGARADALVERLLLTGRGHRPPSAADLAAIEAFAGNLSREVRAAAAAAATTPGTVTPEAGTAGAAAADLVFPASPPPPPMDRHGEADDASEGTRKPAPDDDTDTGPPPPDGC